MKSELFLSYRFVDNEDGSKGIRHCINDDKGNFIRWLTDEDVKCFSEQLAERARAYYGDKNTAKTLTKALEESLKLQSHYAKLLNMHDGGQRMEFPTIEKWINRLQVTGRLPKQKKTAKE